MTLFSGQLANVKEEPSYSQDVFKITDTDIPVQNDPFVIGPFGDVEFANADKDKDGKLNIDEQLRRRRGANHAHGRTSQVKF